MMNDPKSTFESVPVGVVSSTDALYGAMLETSGSSKMVWRETLTSEIIVVQVDCLELCQAHQSSRSGSTLTWINSSADQSLGQNDACTTPYKQCSGPLYFEQASRTLNPHASWKVPYVYWSFLLRTCAMLSGSSRPRHLQGKGRNYFNFEHPKRKRKGHDKQGSHCIHRQEGLDISLSLSLSSACLLCT